MDKVLAEEIKFANRMYYEIQKLRIALGNRLTAKKKDGIVSNRLEKMFADMQDLEKQGGKIAGELVDESGLWDFFLKDVKGIGKLFASALIAEIQDISKFPTVSSLWAYFGLTSQYVLAECSNGHKLMLSSDKHKTCPVFSNADKEPCGCTVTITETVEGQSPRRKAGYHFFFKTKGRTLTWKIVDNFIKQRTPYYRDIYDTEKTKQINLGLKLGHAHNRAIRRVSKIFISHLWEAWRKMEGLDTRPPYVVEKLGHKGYVSIEELQAIFMEEKTVEVA